MTGGPAIRLCAEIEVRPLGEQNGARGNLFGHHDRYLACEARRRQYPCRGSSARGQIRLGLASVLCPGVARDCRHGMPRDHVGL
jgi:hypothetical protein